MTGCVKCGRPDTIQGRHEAVLMVADGFQHPICDDRWDSVPYRPMNVEIIYSEHGMGWKITHAPCGRCGDTERFADGNDSLCSTCGATR